MSQRYIVEVTNAPEAVPDVYRAALAEAFSLPPQKAEQLLKRLPGTVTKPVSKNEAEMVAGRFRQAGLNAVVRFAGQGLERSTVSPASVPATLLDYSATADTAAPTFEAVNKLNNDDLLLDAPYNATPSPYLDDEDKLFIPAVVTVPAAPPQDELVPEEQGAFLDGAALSAALDKTLNTHTEPVKERFRVDLSMLEPAPPASQLEDSDLLLPTLVAKRPRGLRRNLFNVTFIPVLLGLLGALAVVWFTLRPALQADLINAASDAVTLSARSLSTVFSSDAVAELDTLDTVLAEVLTSESFRNQAVQLALVTSAAGEPIASWTATALNGPDETITQVLEAAAQQNQSTTFTAVPLLLGSGERVHVVTAPILSLDTVLGHVTMAVSERAVTQRVLRLLAYVALFSLLPLLLALTLALLGLRPLLGRLHYLTERADAISRGDFGTAIAPRRHDELGRLAEALERLRVSMEEALTRLRQRR